MFSFEDLEKIRQAMLQLGYPWGEAKDNRPKGKNCQKTRKEDGPNNAQSISDCINLGPAQILVIAGFLTGVLQVDSILVNRQQVIEIVLTGSLKKPTQLDKVMEQVGKMPFERVMQSIMDNIE